MASTKSPSGGGDQGARPQCPKCSGDVRTISVPVQGKNRIRYCCVKCRHKFDVSASESGSD